MTHFSDKSNPGTTLCGKPWDAVVDTAVKCRCEACVDIHIATAQWEFPLPTVVAS